MIFGVSRFRGLLPSSRFGKRPREGLARDPRGYAYNDGGISNQKLALLGLIIAADEEERPEDRTLFLPHICVKDQQNKSLSLLPFGKVFLEQIFLEFLHRWNVTVYDERPARIEVVPDADRVEVLGWDYFAKGAGHLTVLGRGAEDARQGIATDFVRALVPRLGTSRALRGLTRGLARVGVHTAAQMRIELDWSIYSRDTLRPLVGSDEDYFLSAEQIVGKIARTLPPSDEPIFVSGDESFLPAPRGEIASIVRAQTGRRIIWKADVLGDALCAALTPLHAALLDYETGLRMDQFVGNSRSTFANLAAFERSVRASPSHLRDYVYNLPGPTLGMRIDRGGEADPYAACGLERPA